MISIKIFLPFLVISLTLGLSTLIAKKIHTSVIFNATAYYHGSCEQFIGTGTDIFECRNSGMTSSYGFDASYWNSSANSAILGIGNFIAKVDYTTADYATIAALLSDLQNYFVTYSNIPTGPFEVVAGKYIIVYTSVCKY